MKVAAGCIVRNGEEYIEENFAALKTFGQKYSAFDVFCVENDSTDGTKDILQKLSEEFAWFHVQSLTLDTMHSTQLCSAGEEYNYSKRTRRLASLVCASLMVMMPFAAKGLGKKSV